MVTRSRTAIVLLAMATVLMSSCTRYVDDARAVAGADLSTPVVDNPEYPPLRIDQSYIDRLEAWCDEFNDELPALTSFILPGGTPLGALLHVARTVARRAERSAWAAVHASPETTSDLPAKYLNRLSDLLFILSRCANPEGDVQWVPGASRSTGTDTD